MPEERSNEPANKDFYEFAAKVYEAQKELAKSLREHGEQLRNIEGRQREQAESLQEQAESLREHGEQLRNIENAQSEQGQRLVNIEERQQEQAEDYQDMSRQIDILAISTQRVHLTQSFPFSGKYTTLHSSMIGGALFIRLV